MAHAERRDDVDPPPEQVRFKPRGYGVTCLACGSLVVGVDGQDTHRRHHRAMAAWWRAERS